MAGLQGLDHLNEVFAGDRRVDAAQRVVCAKLQNDRIGLRPDAPVEP